MAHESNVTPIQIAMYTRENVAQQNVEQTSQIIKFASFDIS